MNKETAWGAGRSGRVLGLLGTVALVLLMFSGGRADAEPPTVDLADLAWLSGSWAGPGLGGEVEEQWGQPADGTMLGMFRLRGDGQTRVIEYLMLTQEGDDVVFRFKHFGTDYQTWEKDQPLILRWVRGSEREAVFESSVQDRPKRMTYRREGDVLTVTVDMIEENGEASSFDMTLNLED